MVQDITLSISLKSKNGAVFLGQRSGSGTDFTETWKQIYGEITKEIPAAYISRDRLDSLKKYYQSCFSSQSNRKSNSYLNKLKKLIVDARKPVYDGQSGFLVRIVRQSDGYHIKTFEVDKKTDLESKADSDPLDFEEIVAGIMEESPPVKVLYTADSKTDNGNGSVKQTPEVRPNPADRYKNIGRLTAPKPVQEKSKK